MENTARKLMGLELLAQPPALEDVPVVKASSAAWRSSEPDQKVEQPFENSLGMKFVAVPGTKCLISVWETRVRDYQAYFAARNVRWEPARFQQGENHPAVNVSWESARAFCEWLTEKEQRDGRISEGQRYRLPTDAEWSAAVGLTWESGNRPYDKDEKVKGQYPWGTKWPRPRNAGNYEGQADSFKYTSAVGSFEANQYGLYDMGGNVWEWCEDEYRPDTGRVLRGASWFSNGSRSLLSSCRLSLRPDRYSEEYGFRCVLSDSER